MTAEKAVIRQRIERYARRVGLALNPDPSRVEEILCGLAVRKRRYGYAYCPCRIVTGDKLQDRKSICPCAYHREEIEREGKCLCELFFKMGEKQDGRSCC